MTKDEFLIRDSPISNLDLFSIMPFAEDSFEFQLWPNFHWTDEMAFFVKNRDIVSKKTLTQIFLKKNCI